jgi:hypothetical protein
MDLFLAWRSTANIEVDRATRANEPEMARRASNGIDTGNMLMQSWVLRTGGEMVVTAGTEGQAKVPAERLDELPGVLEQYEQATDSRVSVGVGFETHEADTALDVAEARGGKPAVVLYNEDVAREAHELEESEESEDLGPLAPEDEALLEDGAPEADGGTEPTLHKAEGDAKPGEASKIAAGSKDPQAAMPSAPSPISPASAPSAPPGQAPAGGGAAAAPGQAQDPEQLRQAIVAVLQDVKKNMPAIQQLQQTDAAAFQAVTGLVQAFVAVAQQAFGGQPMAKSEHEEKVREESSEHPSLPEEDIEQIVEDHERLGKGELHAATPMKPGVRHHLVEPVGTQLDTGSQGTRNAGKVKVRHQDGKTSYVSVRAGQVMSQAGNPISSRNPGGR